MSNLEVRIGDMMFAPDIIKDELFIAISSLHNCGCPIMKSIADLIGYSSYFDRTVFSVGTDKVNSTVRNGIAYDEDGNVFAVHVDNVANEYKNYLKKIEKKMLGYVYVLSNSNGEIKIGSSKTPEKRLKQLQTANAYDLTLLYTYYVYGYSQAERMLHKQCKKYATANGGTEWFTGIKPELLDCALTETFKDSSKYVDNFNYQYSKIIIPSDIEIEDYLNNTYRNINHPLAYEDEDKMQSVNIKINDKRVTKSSDGVVLYNRIALKDIIDKLSRESSLNTL